MKSEIPVEEYIHLVKLYCQWCGSYIQYSKSIVKHYELHGNMCTRCFKSIRVRHNLSFQGVLRALRRGANMEG